MTKVHQQKKQAGGYINSLNMCTCPINLYVPDFWCYLCYIEDGLDNSEFGILY